MSAVFDATYFDGRTSARHDVRVEAAGGRMRVAGPEVALDVALDDVRVEPSVAGDLFFLHLPGGGELRTVDAGRVLTAFPEAYGATTWLRRLEGQWIGALVALIVIGLAATWAIVYGLPAAAKRAAVHVPADVSRTLGQETLRGIDNGRLCKPSELTGARQEEIARRTMQRVLEGPRVSEDAIRVVFRHCPIIGASALALPDGTILLTDDLVKLARDDDDIAAVLAHETGHIHHRHSLRLALQAAGVAALVTALAGDAVSITTLAAVLPAALLQSGYSRELEDEADRYALVRMKEIGIPTERFADMLERIESSHLGRQSYDYLSTHPTTASRIARARRGS